MDARVPFPNVTNRPKNKVDSLYSQAELNDQEPDTSQFCQPMFIANYAIVATWLLVIIYNGIWYNQNVTNVIPVSQTHIVQNP